MPSLTTSSDIGTFLAAANKAAAKTSLEVGTFHYFDTDADKLAATGLVKGDIAVIIDEGNRVEMYIGGTISSQSSWIVLKNTVYMTVSSNTSGFNIAINGVTVDDGDTEIGVGWIDPLYFSIDTNCALKEYATYGIGSVGNMQWIPITSDFYFSQPDSLLPFTTMDRGSVRIKI